MNNDNFTPMFEIELLAGVTGKQGDKGDKGDTGEQGIQGPQGEQGIQGIQGLTGETGPTGNGIASVEQTTTSHVSSGVNVWTLTDTNGTTYDFSVENGEKGDKGDPGDLGLDDIVDNLDSNDSAKVLSAKQGLVLSRIKPYVFDTVADMKAYNLKNGDYAITKGYYAIDDGGAAEYHITAVESSTDYQEELNNELYATLLIIEKLNVKQIGAYGDNTHNDASKLQIALNLNKDIYFDDGTYLTNSTLNFGGKSNITFSKKATIKASAEITSLFVFNNELNADISQNCNITNMHLDGDDKVQNGLILSNYVNLYFENLRIDNCKSIGLLTKGANSRQQAELRITKTCIRNYNYAYDGSIGIQVDSTDGTYSNMSVVDFETAFKINNNGNSFTDLHPWIHFTKLWNNSTAFILPNDGGDITVINGGFVDSIRTAFICNAGLLNVSNMVIYYANNLYNDESESEQETPIGTYIVGYPAQIFYGTNSTNLRISNIYAYIQSGTSNVVTNIVNNDSSISNCLFSPSSAWTGKSIDYARNIPANITGETNITTSYKYCTKTGRLVTICYRGTLSSDVQAFTNIFKLPYLPTYETFFQDGLGIKLYLTTGGYLQLVENKASGTQIRFTLTYLGNII